DVHTKAIDQCVKLQDRFVVFDVYHITENNDRWIEDVKVFRNSTPAETEVIKYAAAYFPRAYASIDFSYKKASGNGDNDEGVKVSGVAATTLAELKSIDNARYFQAKNAIRNIEMLMPLASAMVGV